MKAESELEIDAGAELYIKLSATLDVQLGAVVK